MSWLRAVRAVWADLRHSRILEESRSGFPPRRTRMLSTRSTPSLPLTTGARILQNRDPPRTEPHDPGGTLRSVSKKQGQGQRACSTSKSRCANSKRRAKTRNRIVPPTWFALLLLPLFFDASQTLVHMLSLSLYQSPSTHVLFNETTTLATRLQKLLQVPHLPPRAGQA